MIKPFQTCNINPARILDYNQMIEAVFNNKKIIKRCVA
jgi:hypothetical protein